MKQANDDPVLRALQSAPYDDEPYTDEERRADDAAIREGIEAWKRGEFITTEQLRRELGI